MIPPVDPLFEDLDEPAPEENSDSASLLRDLERLVEAGNADPENESFLEEVVSALARHTLSERVLLSLVDPASGALEPKILRGFGNDPPKEINTIQDGIQGWVVRLGAPMMLTDPSQTAGIPLLAFETPPLLAAPIQVGATRVGAVTIQRPLRPGGYTEEDALVLAVVASHVGGLLGHARAQSQGREAMRKVLESLTLALDARDPYTRGHSQRVAMYSIVIANELEEEGTYSFVKELRNSLVMSALLHDIGKIAIRDDILFKPGKLTPDEYAVVKTHPEKGADIVRMIPGLDENVIAGILEHHEKMDGKGYPRALKGDQIHIFGRIIGLADAFDAIVTSRPYAEGASYQFALSRIEELSGTAFDPVLVRAMMRGFRDQNAWKELSSVASASPGSSAAKEEIKDSDGADRTLRRVFGRSVSDLPTLPHVVSQVLEKTRDHQNANLTEITSLIATDQALVTMYLKLVNSAFYGFSRRITTLQQAITLLGFRSVRNVIVNAGVVGMFRKRSFNNRHRLHLWEHSVSCAVATRVLAPAAGFQAKEEAFTAGLLHDIGKVVIDQYAPRSSMAVLRKMEAGMDPRAAEREVLGSDHTEIGYLIAERWNLPKSLCSVIRWHHEPSHVNGTSDEKLVNLVASANALAKVRKAEDMAGVRAAAEEFARSPWNLFQLDEERSRASFEEFWSARDEAMRLFGPRGNLGPAAEAKPSEEGPDAAAPDAPARAARAAQGRK
jgi:putative nucleotidyltransferase with HDIG domain